MNPAAHLMLIQQNQRLPKMSDGMPTWVMVVFIGIQVISVGYVVWAAWSLGRNK